MGWEGQVGGGCEGRWKERVRNVGEAYWLCECRGCVALPLQSCSTHFQ